MHDALKSLFAELIAQQTKGRASFGTLSKTTYEYHHLRRYAQQFSSASEVKSLSGASKTAKAESCKILYLFPLARL